MNKDKFIQSYSFLYPNGKANKFCKNVFKVFDPRNSGEIKFAEFMLAISVTTPGMIKKKLNNAFIIYDIDQNGVVDRNEMEKIIAGIYELLDTDMQQHEGKKLAHERVNQIFLSLDKNMDDCLSKDEFIEGCLNDSIIKSILVPSV